MKTIQHTTSYLLRESEAADHLGVSVSWLQKARVRGDGPIYAKLGHAIRYRRSDIQEFIESRLRRSTSDTREEQS